jgi:uroporphyrinogen decarboxylase
MNGRERILCAFNHQKADRLPVFDIINKPDMYVDLLGKDNYESGGRLAVQLAKKVGMDAVTVHSKPYTCLIPPKSEFDSPDIFTDRFGIINKVTDTSWPLGMAINPREATEELLEQIRNAKVTDEDVRQVKEAVEEANGEIAVFGSVRGTFGFLFILLGLEHMAEAIYDEPELLEELINAATEFWTELGLKLIGVGCDALYVANDMGMNDSTLISPNHLREFFFPALKKQIETWKQAGGRVLLHSCGNINAVLEDLADMGIDAINNIQVRAGMNLADVKARIGDRVTIVGNVDATGIMCQNDKNLIAKAIEDVVNTAGQDGALIIATDHSFHEGIPTENVLYFLDNAKEIGNF